MTALHCKMLTQIYVIVWRQWLQFVRAVLTPVLYWHYKLYIQQENNVLMIVETGTHSVYYPQPWYRLTSHVVILWAEDGP